MKAEKIKNADIYEYWFVAVAIEGGKEKGFAADESWGISNTPYLGNYTGKYRDGNENILVFYKYEDVVKWINNHNNGSIKYEPRVIHHSGKYWEVMKSESVPEYMFK